MAYLDENATWEQGIYQWETQDPVVGGPDGIDNVPTRQLANRTGYLKEQIAAHAAATDPHPQYLQQSEGDALYDKTGAASTSMAGHVAAIDPHPQYLQQSEGNQLYDKTGAAAASMTGHLTATDPHPQYLQQAKGDSLYDKTGAASASMAGHLAETDPHPQYTTDAEVAALLQKGLPMVSTTAQQFDNSTKAATTAFVQRALGNLNGAVQLAVNATTTLTAAQAGGLWQVQAGTVNLPASAGMVPGATYTLWSSGDATVVANNTDKIYVANNGVSSFKMGANDFVTLVWQQAGVWAVTSGSSVLGYTAAFGSLKSANGYQKLPSGVIIQWGATMLTVANSWQPVTLPMALPNAVFQTIGSSASANSPGYAYSISNSQIGVMSINVGAVVPWLVIGI